MFPVTCLDLICRYPLALIAVILEPFLAIGLGIYSGFNIKKRWFLPIIECFTFYVLFKSAEWLFMRELIIMKFEVIVLCIWLTLSLLAMFVTAIMRRKKPFWIRIILLRKNCSPIVRLYTRLGKTLMRIGFFIEIINT